MRNNMANLIRVISMVGCFILFSCATTQHVRLKSRDAEGYNNRGFAYYQTGQYEKAISDFTKAIEIDPQFAQAYNNRGWVYVKKCQYDQALSDFNKSTEIDPGFVEAYFCRAIVYFIAEEYDKSFLNVMKAQQLGYQIPLEFLDDLQKAVGDIDM